MGLGPALGQVPWYEKLRRTIVRRRGVRLGEAAVVSRQVHMVDQGHPHIVIVCSTADVGQAYYGLAAPGEIIHIDIFHAVADIDHKAVAGELKRALAGVPAAGGEGMELLDYFDVQTGLGGGRVTGELTYGQKASLRAAHRNHVHLAGRLTDEQVHYLVDLVGAVEQAIQAQGVELRRIEKLSHNRGTDGAKMDLSHYMDPNSDSFLRGRGSGSPGAQGGLGAGQGQVGAESAGGGQSLRSGARAAPGAAANGGGGASGAAGAAGEAGASGVGSATGAPGAGEGTTAAPDPVGGRGAPSTGWDALETERRLQAALELSRKLGSPDEVKRVLDELTREQGWSSLYGSGSSQAPFIINQLEAEGLVKRDIRGLRLTDAGKDLAAYLGSHLRDVKLRFRKLIRRMPSSSQKATRKPGQGKSRPSADVRYGPIRGTAPAEPGSWFGDLAVPDTVRSGLKRTRLAAIESDGPKPVGIRLARQDIHVHLRSGEQPLNICLLIDASASMAGRRILAAKHLARHLLVSTRDRVAVIAFQERDVKVYVPFTRDWAQVEEGLSRIQPMGLTPLAHGLTQSMDLIRQSRVRRPLLLLITDGIPTVPKWSVDPLADALEAARCVGAGRVPFGCIGLQPSRRYLEELVRVAGGSLHVVEELDEEALVTIAHHERIRIAQKAR
jgi:Mg-chelatase subunit ChlD